MDVWIAAGASAIAALCAAAAWHAATLNRKDIHELSTRMNSRWTESLGDHGRAERSIGQVEGIQHERADNLQRLEDVAATGVAVIELPTQLRVPNGGE